MSTLITIAGDPLMAAALRTEKERPWADHVHFDGSWCDDCLPPKPQPGYPKFRVPEEPSPELPPEGC